jgi:hypothetical protein
MTQTTATMPSRGRPRAWTRELAISEYQRAAQRLGRAPSVPEIKQDPLCTLPASQIYKLFDSLQELCEAAGYEYQRRSHAKYTPKRMLNRLVWLYQTLDRVPAPGDYRTHYDDGYQYYVRQWGSFDSALEAAGISQELPVTTPQQAQLALQQCARQLGRVPTQREYRIWAMQIDEETGEISFSAQRPRPAVLRTLHGSYRLALVAAGLTSAQSVRERALQSLRVCCEQLGQTPTADQYRQWAKDREDAASLAEVLGAWGKWNQALQAADLPVNGNVWNPEEIEAWIGAWRFEVGVERPTRQQWDRWVSSQEQIGPKSATLARVVGGGSWRRVWR